MMKTEKKSPPVTASPNRAAEMREVYAGPEMMRKYEMKAVYAGPDIMSEPEKNDGKHGLAKLLHKLLKKRKKNDYPLNYAVQPPREDGQKKDDDGNS